MLEELPSAACRITVQRERREAAAADVQIATEPNGCLPFARRTGWPFGSHPYGLKGVERSCAHCETQRWELLVLETLV